MSNFIAAFVSPPLLSPADLAAARGQLELNLNAPIIMADLPGRQERFTPEETDLLVREPNISV